MDKKTILARSFRRVSGITDNLRVLGDIKTFKNPEDRELAKQIDKEIGWFARPVFVTDRRYKLPVKSECGDIYEIEARLEKLSEVCKYLPEAPVHNHYQRFSVRGYGVAMGPAFDLKIFGDDIFEGKDHELMEDQDIQNILAQVIIDNIDHFETVRAKAKVSAADFNL